jgi:GNAT superfamily N-acetyltransferase
MIRNAEDKDITRLVELGAVMHSESKFAQYSFDPWKLHSLIEFLSVSSDGIALVAEKDGEVVGGFLGFIQAHFFGRDLASYDYGLFVAPEHRASTIGPRLIKAYIAEAKSRGVAEICIANSTGVNKDRIGRLFEHMGFSHDGYVFSMNAQED